MRKEILKGVFLESGNIIVIGETAFLAVAVGDKLYGVSHEETSWTPFVNYTEPNSSPYTDWMVGQGIKGIYSGLHSSGFYPKYTANNWGEMLYSEEFDMNRFAKFYGIDAKTLKDFVNKNQKIK